MRRTQSTGRGTIEMPRTILAGTVDSQSPGRSFAHANSTQSCRPREALLSSGPLCLKNGTPSCRTKRFGSESRTLGVRTSDFGMKRSRIGSALAGMAVCAAGVRAAVAACARRRRHSGRAGRSGRTLRSPAQFCSAEQPGCDRAEHRGGAGRQRRRSRRQLCRSCRGRKTFPFSDELSRRVSDAVTRGKFVVAFRQALCHRARDRKRRRCRQPVGHGRRRSVRVRRHQGRGARRQASGDGRGHRPAGAGPRRRGPRGDGGDLCLGRRRRRRCAPVSRWSRMPARSGGWARG